MKETNSSFFKNCKHPSGFNKIYTQHLNGYNKATYNFFLTSAL